MVIHANNSPVQASKSNQSHINRARWNRWRPPRLLKKARMRWWQLRPSRMSRILAQHGNGQMPYSWKRRTHPSPTARESSLAPRTTDLQQNMQQLKRSPPCKKSGRASSYRSISLTYLRPEPSEKCCFHRPRAGQQRAEASSWMAFRVLR